MSIDVTATTRIRRPLCEVFAYVTNPANEPEWISGISESVPETPGSIAKGSKVRRVANFMGGHIEYTPEVVEFEPDHRLRMVTDKPFPMTIDYAFSERDGATVFEQRLRGGPAGFGGVLSPLMALMVRRRISSDMRRLAAILECQR